MDGCFAYIVRCADDTFYCGWTNNLQKRVEMHSSGKGARYTRSRAPVELVYFERYLTRQEAMRREWQLKQLSHAEKAVLADTTGTFLRKVFFQNAEDGHVGRIVPSGTQNRTVKSSGIGEHIHTKMPEGFVEATGEYLLDSSTTMHVIAANNSNIFLCIPELSVSEDVLPVFCYDGTAWYYVSPCWSIIVGHPEYMSRKIQISGIRNTLESEKQE